jgi:phospho-N-acetylmuramoyl-pentapeptide-transferase
MVTVLIAAIVAMVISIVAGPRFIRFLQLREYGQHIREEGPAGHVAKQGTPTMGGLLILFAAAAPFLILTNYSTPALTVFF